MKVVFSLLLACSLVASLITAPIFFTGCGTPTAKTTQVAGSVTITVDAAMQSWGEWVRANKATVEQRVQVRAAYQKYQAAMAIAEKVAISVLTAPEQQAAYITALNTASQVSVELIALVEQFTRKQ